MRPGVTAAHRHIPDAPADITAAHDNAIESELPEAQADRSTHQPHEKEKEQKMIMGNYTMTTPVVAKAGNGRLIWTCQYCRQPIADGKGALMSQDGKPWEPRCFDHEPPRNAEGQRPWYWPVDALRTAEQVLMALVDGPLILGDPLPLLRDLGAALVKAEEAKQ